MRARERLPYLAAAALAALLLREALALEAWSFLGPGPGLFPQLTLGIAMGAALLLACFPDAGRPRDGEPEPVLPQDAEARRGLAHYAAALPAIGVGVAWLGFAGTALMLALLLTWRAERRSLTRALAFAGACAALGILVFATLLGATLPEAAPDRLLRSLLR